MKSQRYPKIGLRSKNELAKRISDRRLSVTDALLLINNVLKNKDLYWHDSKYSQPEKDKYVRSAQGTALGLLLKLVDKKILRPHDKMLPYFIFGGLSGRNHVKAAQFLLGVKNKRILLSADMKRFFEQIKKERVYNFFYRKCTCSKRLAKLLAEICCIPAGPKGSIGTEMVLARGFATSVRLAVWANIDVFLKVFWVTKKILRGKSCRLAIFVDDIGVCASHADKETLSKLYTQIEKIFNTYDPSQPLVLNKSKRNIQSYETGIEYLGLKLEKNKISLGGKTRAKISRIKQKVKLGNIDPALKRARRGLMSYKRYVQSFAEQK